MLQQNLGLKKKGTGFMDKLFNRESIVFKVGSKRNKPLLTTVEESSLDPSAKAEITDIVIKHTDNTGISEFVGGQQLICN